MPSTSERVFTFLGLFVLVGIVLSAWIPQPCPILRDKLIGCPQPTPTVVSADDLETRRVIHSEISTNYVFITAKAQSPRNQTAVNFEYRPSHTMAGPVFLQLKEADGYDNLALVYHPLLANLNWQSTTIPGYQLYQRTPTYDSIDAFLKALPPASEVAIDSMAAAAYNLNSNQYVTLDSLGSLNSIQYILTSYVRPTPDGSWFQFHRTIDASTAVEDAHHELGWALRFQVAPSKSDPFLLGTVHIDYSQSR